MLFLRCLRDFEKWSWIEKMRKNRQKWAKIAASESAKYYYFLLFPMFSNDLLSRNVKTRAYLGKG